MIQRLNFFIFFLLITILKSYTQSVGNSSYEFLRLTNTARQAALGGNLLSVNDNDISLVLSNPALINENIDNKLLVNFVDYYSGINYGITSYAKNFDKFGTFVASLQYINYGKFTEADETGVILGEFTSAEYAFTVGWAKKLSEKFTLGANLKGIHSSLYTYNSSGIATDLALNYYNSDRNISSTILFKNIGRQITTYTTNFEPLPFEIQIAASKRLEHVPLRFHLLLHNLQKYDISYADLNTGDNIDPLTGEIIEPSKISQISNNLMHHVIIGAEINPTRNVFFRFGYNYHRRKEMTVPTRLSTVGFSWGVGIKISKFNINYSRSMHHLAGSPNNISITTRLTDFF